MTVVFYLINVLVYSISILAYQIAVLVYRMLIFIYLTVILVYQMMILVCLIYVLAYRMTILVDWTIILVLKIGTIFYLITNLGYKVARGQSQRDCVSKPKVAVLGYLGKAFGSDPTPKGLRLSLIKSYYGYGRNPFGVEKQDESNLRASASQGSGVPQPWAERSNPFGVVSAMADSLLFA